jgi:GH25 family lysozyme M1 (1,4-beta-N-acetylmuramidase)
MGSTIAEHEPESLAPVTTVPPITTAPAVDKKGTAELKISPAMQATGTTKSAVQTAAGSPPGIPGLDVSGWQVLNAGSWASIAANGARFAYVKATEATDYVSSQFSEQYTDSYNAGLLHGAYHFATPNTSNGAAQANWFLNHGGQGSADGRTMPPLLDIEYNPYGATCYGLSAGAMVGWISDFSATIQARTGRLPAIYSTTNWWAQCTGNSAAFGANPLFIARYPNNIADGAGTLPAGWSSYTLWQYASSGIFPGDQDVFNGSLTDLTTYGLSSSVVRTVANASVYLVAGTSKYPVSSMDIMNALSPLGRIAYVPQSYLDQFTTRQTAGRVIRSPDGTISFFDAGMRLPFPSCALVTDYGGSCDPSGYIQLTAVQFAAFVGGTGMTPLMTSSGGPLYDVAGGARHEALDFASLTQAGIGAQVNYLTPSALSYLPLGAPIVRDNVYAQQSGTSTGVLILGGKASSIDPSAAQFVGFPGAAAGSLQAESISKLTPGSPFVGAFRSAADSSVSVLASDGIHPWAQGVGGASFPSVTVPPAFLSTYHLGTAIQAGSAIMSPSNGTVFLVMPNDIRPISSWDALVALSGGKSPSITVVPQALLATLPQGPVALTSGSLVRSTGNATVYLVNGVTNKIPFSTFDPATEAGFTSFSFTTDDRLAAYPTSSSLLSFGVQCGSQKYVSAGGAIHALGSGTSGLYPFSFVSLDSFTCTLATKGIDATAFIRTPDGSIYYLSNGQKHAITSMTRFTQLSNGQPYLDVVSAFAKAIPTGPDA